MIDFTLMDHQKKALYDSQFKPDMLLAWQMGVGKTCATIQILRHRYMDAGELTKTLIITPLITLKNWKEEFAMFSNVSPDAIHVLKGSRKKRAKQIEALEGRNGIIITNYESFDGDDVAEAITKWSPRIMVCDEVHLCKNPQSKRAKKIAKISDLCSNHYLLTGTPILNSSMDLFMPFRILDGYRKKESTFGSNFFVFRGVYFEDANAAWSGQKNHFPDWQPRPSTYSIMQDKIKDKMSVVDKLDVLDLPPLITENRYCVLSKEQETHYKEMKSDLITYVKDMEDDGVPKAVVARLAITKALRMQQIVTGFVKSDAGEIIKIVDNPRERLLKELLEELTPNHKVIVWAIYKENYATIRKVCEDIGVSYTSITGSQSTKDKFSNMVQFDEDPDCKVLIANPASAGVGINLVASSYSIYYSRSYKLGDYKQSEARNWRKGSEMHDRITHINLIASNTIDEFIDKALKDKQNLADMILDIKEKL